MSRVGRQIRSNLVAVGTVLGSCAFLCLSAAPTAAANLFDQGLKDYKSGLYSRAANSLSLACREEPMNAVNHYYLANTLVHLQQHQQAIKEYRVSYILNPKSEVAEYCRQALLLYKEPIPSNSESKFVRDTVFGGAAPDKTQINGLMGNQLERAKARNQKIADHRMRQELDVGEEEARRIEQRQLVEAQRGDAFVPSQFYRLNPQLLNPRSSAQSEHEMRTAIKDQQSKALRTAKQRAERYRNWFGAKDNELQRVAENIAEQIKTSNSNKWQMQPKGTDLYVRTYGYGRNGPPKTGEDVRPAVARIYAHPYVSPEDATNPAAPGAPESAVRSD